MSEYSPGFKAKLEQLDSTVWSICLVIPPKNAKPHLGGKDRRVMCKLNNQIEIHAALLPKSKNFWFININKDIRKKLKLEVGSEVSLQLKKDESKYGMPLPEEMEAVLESDPDANEVFHSLTPGRQRSLLYLIGKPKSSDIRMTKAIKITEYLKMTGGKLDFREMNEWIKGN